MKKLKGESGLGNLLDRFQEADPSLTSWGILSTIFQSTSAPNRFSTAKGLKANGERIRVYVSCLIRTWMTAVLLYGSHFRTIELRIAPFLKEENDIPENFPLPFHEQVKKFVHFLLLLRSWMSGSESLTRAFDPLRELFEIKITSFMGPESVVIRNPFSSNASVDPVPTTGFQYGRHLWMEDSARWVNGQVNAIQWSYSNPPRDIDQQSAARILATVGQPSSMVASQKITKPETTNLLLSGVTGPEKVLSSDLQKFLGWLTNEEPSISEMTEIHCVAHSGMMNKFLKTLSFQGGNKNEQNTWSVELEIQETKSYVLKNEAVLHAGKCQPKKNINQIFSSCEELCEFGYDATRRTERRAQCTAKLTASATVPAQVENCDKRSGEGGGGAKRRRQRRTRRR